MKISQASQALEPDWTSAQETAGDKLLSVDCSTETALCRQHGVSSFPTIRLHHPDGTQARYRGPRKAESILSFLRRTARPALSHVTPKNTTTFQSIDDIVILGHFTRGTALQQQFQETAAQYHDRYSFGLIPNAQAQGPKMECINNLDSVHRPTAEFPSPTSIEAFVKLCATRLIPEFTRRNELSFYEVNLPLSPQTIPQTRYTTNKADARTDTQKHSPLLHPLPPRPRRICRRNAAPRKKVRRVPALCDDRRRRVRRRSRDDGSEARVVGGPVGAESE